MADYDCGDRPHTLSKHVLPPIAVVPMTDPIPLHLPTRQGGPDLQTTFVLIPPTAAFAQSDTWSPNGVIRHTEWNSPSPPDLDDTSLNSVVFYMEQCKDDLRWSVVSNSFFITGGLCYFILTTWNCVLKWDWGDTTSPSSNWIYISLDVCAPTVYLCNSIVDFCWVEYSRLQQREKGRLIKLWEDTHNQLYGISSYYTNEDEEHFSSGKCRLWSRVRKHAAHRRTLAATLTFGIAAYFGVIATILRNWYLPSMANSADHDRWVYKIDGIDQWTDHINVASALISMTGKRHRSWFAPSDPHGTSWFHDSERLIDLGDLLFFIGSLIYALLTDFHLDHLVLFPVLSSLFWMIDGILYMRSDMLKATKLKEAEFSLVDQSVRVDNTPPISLVV